MKMMKFFTALSRYRLLLLTGVIVTIGNFGCANSHELTLTSLEHRQSYSQGFTQAYACRNVNGDIDLVLIDRASEQALNGAPDATPVRQVMHIRVVWAPTRDMKAVTSNASVKWYVIGRSRPRDLLEYSGIAFVSFQDGDATMTFNVRNAQLTPSGNHGNLIDPVGKSQLEGTITAQNDSQAVDKILASMQTVLTAANNQVPVAAR